MVDDTDHSNLVFHEYLGEGRYGRVDRVTFKKPYRGYTEAAAKTIISFRKEEVEILSKLSHPNIVKWIGFCQHEPVHIILTEYAKNGSLRAYLSNKANSLSDNLKLKWIRESALAIQYLHDNRCLHRDIKGSNCLLSKDNTLILCDFGLAREIDHSIIISSQKGTSAYMAPEIIRTDQNNKATFSIYTDIYAYGMLVHEIWTRNLPFPDLESGCIMYQVGEYQLQLDIAPDTPEDLAEIMRNCWKITPDERPKIEEIVAIVEGKHI